MLWISGDLGVPQHVASCSFAAMVLVNLRIYDGKSLGKMLGCILHYDGQVIRSMSGI